MAIEDRIHAVIAPVIEDLDLELVDLVYGGGRLRVTIDHPSGLDTELLTRATRLVSHELDLNDPISGKYTLEVSSPGIERPLRTPAHFLRSVGEQVSVKLVPSVDGARRIAGELVAADGDSITVVDGETNHVLRYVDIAKANTVYDWAPTPKPGKARTTAPKSESDRTASDKTAPQKTAPEKTAPQKTAPEKTAATEKAAAEKGSGS